MNKEESLQGILITVLYLVKCGTFKAWGELVCKKTHILHVFANLGIWNRNSYNANNCPCNLGAPCLKPKLTMTNVLHVA